MKKEIYTELLAKKLSGNATAKEQQALSDWRAQSQENEKFAQKAEELWLLSASYKEKTFVADTNTAWNKVEAKINTQKDTAQIIKMKTWRSMARIAAVFVFLIGAYSLWQNGLNSSSPNIDILVFQTQSEETKLVELPDSSKVWLNENSKITYPSDFQSRDVSLVGEAFFEVARKKDSPFNILSEGATTTVLGTSFNIRAYPNEKEVKLTVKTGKVAFSAESNNGTQKTSILTVGETASFIKAKSSLTDKEAVDINDFAWQTRSLKFEGTSLMTVQKTLEKYYGIDIEVKNPATLSCRFNGGKFENAKLSEMLEILSLALDLQITKSGETYIIEGEGCE